MSLARIKIVLLYSWYHFIHSMETWVDVFWFPTIEIIAFGLLSAHLQKIIGSNSIEFILYGLIMWEIVRIPQYSVTVSVLWNVWSNNFQSLFVTPLTMGEFLLGESISAVIKTGAFLFGVVPIVMWLIFQQTIFSLGLPLLLFVALLTWFSIMMGVFIVALIIRFGTDIQSMAWGLIFLLQPFSAVLYPVEALPPVLRPIALAIPVTYVMENVRNVISGRPLVWRELGMAVFLNLVWTLIILWFFRYQLRWAKRTGAFARLES